MAKRKPKSKAKGKPKPQASLQDELMELGLMDSAQEDEGGAPFAEARLG